MIIAVTVHNIPGFKYEQDFFTKSNIYKVNNLIFKFFHLEGLAVGVGFGA
jgi:hypothetical protein